jgi:hypothetical protein
MTDPYAAALSRLARWLADAWKRILNQVNVIEQGRRSGKTTLVAVDHRLSCDLEMHAGWHIQTKPTFLPRDHFSSQARAYVKNAERARGRAMYCHDLIEQEVVAVMSYHIDEDARMPILITTLGFRIDIAGNAFLRYRTMAGALVLKHHAHAVAEKIGRGGFVDMDLADKAQFGLARELGFQPAPQVKGFRPGNLHLRQPAPVRISARADSRQGHR